MAGAGGKKLILVVIDGLTPAMLERGLGEGRVPSLAHLVENGTYVRGVTTFPSVTPVCLASLATGAHPDGHHIAHLAWYHRGEGRIVEYGSSFYAMRAVGARRSIRDSIFDMSHAHLSRDATTVFEAVQDAGLTPAAINMTCYRGRTRHAIRLPFLATRNRWYEAVYGPKRFFFFNLFESDATGAPLAVRSRLEGSTDAYAGVVGRWLVTRDGFDFLLFYLPDFDYASHLTGPASPLDALARADAAIGELMAAAGGADALLDRYAVVVCSDHGQTHVEEVSTLQDAFADLRVLRGRRRTSADGYDVVVTGSNRSGMVYRLPGCRLSVRELAERLDSEPAADVVLFREAGEAIARREGEELRFTAEPDGWRLAGDPAVLDPAEYPDGHERAWRALACPNAGEIVVSAREGWELADVGGRHHAGGGSHGSLAAGDSLVPIVAAGLDERLGDRPSITDLAPLVLRHLGIEPPASMHSGGRERVAA
ncbi:MAG: alkaline phosphatase family protein [Thermoleophilia bacterium]|nr:alkaline phosphatase family protein [Thermoleophilia bacterium]